MSAETARLIAHTLIADGVRYARVTLSNGAPLEGRLGVKAVDDGRRFGNCLTVTPFAVDGIRDEKWTGYYVTEAHVDKARPPVMIPWDHVVSIEPSRAEVIEGGTS